MNKENKIKIEQFIGVFSNAINDELCSKFIKWFDTASEQNLSKTASEDTKLNGNQRKDELLSCYFG